LLCEKLFIISQRLITLYIVFPWKDFWTSKYLHYSFLREHTFINFYIISSSILASALEIIKKNYIYLVKWNSISGLIFWMGHKKDSFLAWKYFKKYEISLLTSWWIFEGVPILLWILIHLNLNLVNLGDYLVMSGAGCLVYPRVYTRVPLGLP